MTGWLFVFAAGLAEVAGVMAMNAISNARVHWPMRDWWPVSA